MAAANGSHRAPASSAGKLKWTGSVVELVELVYALHAAGVVNGGKASLKRLFGVLGGFFDFEVGEYSRSFIDIKSRVKGDRTSFLDTLKRVLLRRMEEADIKPRKR